MLSENFIAGDSDGKRLYQIIALKSFSDIEKGEVGGYVEDLRNLSQYGNCWIYDNAKVFDDAKVSENAVIAGDAKLECMMMQ
jgi:hypothetical protein